MNSNALRIAALLLLADSAFAQAPAPTPQPAATAPSAPQPTPAPPPASAQVGVDVNAAAGAPAAVRETTQPSEPYGGSGRQPSSKAADERRVAIFTDGESPSFTTSGSRRIGGSLELEVRFRNANPLCYAYSTNIAASRAAANQQPLPARAPSIGAFGNLTATELSDLDQGLGAVATRQNELDELLHASRYNISLDDVWAACDGNPDFADQRLRVNRAAATASERLGPNGAWTQMLRDAESTALGAKRLARRLVAEGSDAKQLVEARRATLRDAERSERASRSQEGHGQATVAVAAAQRGLREAELSLARHARALELERAAEGLSEQVQTTVEQLSTMVADINRARSLLARSPTALRRTFGPGETIHVQIKRQRLERGEIAQGRGPQIFALPAFETLRPVILDIGLGPAVAVDSYTSNYKTVFSPRSAEDNTPTWRVVETEQGLDVDVLVSISAYVWKRRYYDDRVFNAWGLLPRPMVGVSLRHPFDALYVGALIDPLQYVNIGGGVRFANAQELVGPQPLDRALIDADGEPQPPVTRDEVKVSAFVTLTVSSNLIYQWIAHGL